MREIEQSLSRWWSEGRQFALATVVGVRGSAPREPGAVLAVGPGGEVVGSVSGGCVEGAVYEEAERVLTDGEPLLASYGISDEDALAVGLTCGGTLDVLVQRLDPERSPAFGELLRSLSTSEPVALATVIGGPALGAQLVVWPDRAGGSLGDLGLDAAVTDDARGLLAQGRTISRGYGARGERRLDELTVFVQAFAPPPHMIVFGAIDFAASVARIGSFLGYRVTVCDARPVFTTRTRFPDADEVVCEWPHKFLARTPVDSRTVICVLTHDPKFDVPVLEIALRSPAAYVGAMGSRRTHEDRLARLREVGLREPELERLHSPVGLEIGARTPEETAVSIAAEIIKCRWGGSGRPLADTAGRIHFDVAAARLGN